MVRLDLIFVVEFDAEPQVLFLDLPSPYMK